MFSSTCSLDNKQLPALFFLSPGGRETTGMTLRPSHSSSTWACAPLPPIAAPDTRGSHCLLFFPVYDLMMMKEKASLSFWSSAILDE